MNAGPRFKARLRAGEPVALVNPDHPSASLVESLGKAGVDAVMIDVEQGSSDVESVEHMARAARLTDLCAVVRIFTPEPWVVERYLFRGIDGLVVPRLETPDQARALVDAVRYCYPKDPDTKVIIVQIESVAAVKAIDGFLDVDAIDAFFIGPVDLAKSAGTNGDYNDPRVAALIDEAIAAITARNRPVGMLTNTADVARWRAKGVTLCYTHVDEFLRIGARSFEGAMRSL